MDNMLSLIGANLRDAICLTDLQGKITYVSPAIEAVLQMKPEEVTGKSFLDFVAPGQEEKLMEEFASVIADGNRLQAYDVIVVDRHGNHLQVETTASALLQNGVITGTVSTLRDVTMQRKFEQVTAFLSQKHFSKDGRDFFHALAEFLGQTLPADYICIDILSGDCLEARTLAIYTDGSFEDNVTYRLTDTPCGEVAHRGFCCYPAKVAELYPRDRVLTEMGAQGYVGTVLYDSDGAAIGLLAVIFRRTLEHPDEIAKIIRTVAVRASGELERLIFQEILQNSKKELAASLQEKELILKEVHHRIKNNLTTVIGLLTLHADSIQASEAVNALEDAAGRVRSMLHLYDRLYGAGGFQQSSVREYLGPLAREIISTFPRANDIDLQIRIDDFVLDIRRLLPLGIIINELLTNAMKYAFQGRERGLISLEVTLNKGRVVLFLSDNGRGFPADFNMVEKRNFGLLLVEMLCGQLEGRFQFNSDDGLQFQLTFNCD